MSHLNYIEKYHDYHFKDEKTGLLTQVSCPVEHEKLATSVALIYQMLALSQTLNMIYFI